MGGKVLIKRDLTVYDESKAEIRLTVWGDKARENEGFWADQIVAIKGCKVGDYQGRTLSTTQNSSVVLNPHPHEIPEALRLNQWRQLDATAGQGLSSLSSAGGGMDRSGSETVEKRQTLSSVREEGVGHNDKGDYFSFKATVNYIKHDNNDPWYTACPTCNKKVVDIGGGSFRCEKCNKEYPECNYRYIMSLTLADWSGSQWVSAFDDVGELIMGASAKDMHLQKMDGGEEAVERVYKNALFKTYCMRVSD